MAASSPPRQRDPAGRGRRRSGWSSRSRSSLRRRLRGRRSGAQRRGRARGDPVGNQRGDERTWRSIRGDERPAGRVKNAILIAGPTASGKSALALELAERTGGVVINADSMQVYAVLDVLTARPARRGSGTRAAPPLRARRSAHRLFDGRLAARRREHGRGPDRRAGDLHRRHRPLFPRAGRGHSEMPDIPAADPRPLALAGSRGRPGRCTASWRARTRKRRRALKPADGQRIVRALEVLEASGRLDPGLAGRERPPLDRPRHGAPSSSSSRTARNWSGGSSSASTEMVEEGALDECARWPSPRSASIRRCRR